MNYILRTFIVFQAFCVQRTVDIADRDRRMHRNHLTSHIAQAPWRRGGPLAAGGAVTIGRDTKSGLGSGRRYQGSHDVTCHSESQWPGLAWLGPSANRRSGRRVGAAAGPGRGGAGAGDLYTVKIAGPGFDDGHPSHDYHRPGPGSSSPELAQ